ncbi:hypothetical protein ABEF90_00540 [Acinetobacter thermotolerans]|uniref:hypothetical protein n=1 Tax=Acinetobacter thermotolerans TaxID=3151487 RepID=UPI00325A96BC
MDNITFEKYHPKVNLWFNFAFKKSEIRTSCLIVVLSPNSKFMLSSHNFLHDTLYVSEKSTTYYTFSIDVLSQVVSDFSKQLKKRKIIFVGSSKSGFGAINLGRMQKKIDNLIGSYSLSFSPVTRVYPLEKPHPYKTYPSFIKKIESNKTFKRCAERFGLLFEKPNMENYKEIIYIGSYSAYDIRELSYLLSVSKDGYKYIDINLVPTQSHNITALFAFADLPFNEFMNRCLVASENDLELQWTKADSEILTLNSRKIYDSVRNKTISNLIAEIIDNDNDLFY